MAPSDITKRTSKPFLLFSTKHRPNNRAVCSYRGAVMGQKKKGKPLSQKNQGHCLEADIQRGSLYLASRNLDEAEKAESRHKGCQTALASSSRHESGGRKGHFYQYTATMWPTITPEGPPFAEKAVKIIRYGVEVVLLIIRSSRMIEYRKRIFRIRTIFLVENRRTLTARKSCGLRKDAAVGNLQSAGNAQYCACSCDGQGGGPPITRVIVFVGKRNRGPSATVPKKGGAPAGVWVPRSAGDGTGEIAGGFAAASWLVMEPYGASRRF